MFACLDSDDEEAPKVVAPKVVAPAPTAAAPAVGKAAGNKAGPAGRLSIVFCFIRRNLASTLSSFLYSCGGQEGFQEAHYC